MSVSAVVCVLLMFFFPLPHGNFQSTHGPVTALRSMRALFLLVFSMLSAALQTLARVVPFTSLVSGLSLRSCVGQFWSFDFDRCSSILRC